MKNLKISIPDFIAEKLDKKKLKTLIAFAKQEIAEWTKSISTVESKIKELKK